jgi:hypothetical protein
MVALPRVTGPWSEEKSPVSLLTGLFYDEHF